MLGNKISIAPLTAIFVFYNVGSFEELKPVILLNLDFFKNCNSVSKFYDNLRKRNASLFWNYNHPVTLKTALNFKYE